MLPGERAGAVPQLITLLGDSDEWVRMAAARALGELRDERALTDLLRNARRRQLARSTTRRVGVERNERRSGGHSALQRAVVGCAC